MKKRRRLSNNREGVSSELAETLELTPHQAQISPSHESVNALQTHVELVGMISDTVQTRRVKLKS